jgi:hypothetical protein
MIKRLLILFFLLSIGVVKAQFVSTIFLDTIDITVNNKRIFLSNETSLRFIPNNNSQKLIVYNDGTYKLVLNFTLSKSKNYSSLILSNENFYYHDTICSLSLVGIYATDYDECNDILIAGHSLQNWQYNKPIPAEKTQIKICYRLFNFAPKDTLNYNYNYRQGLWIGSHEDAKVVTVNYKNDKKDGLATALYEDSSSYNVYFKNNIANNYGRGYWDNKNKKNKFKFKYTLPNIVSLTCDSTQNQTHTSFYLKKGKKTKEIYVNSDLSIYSYHIGQRNENIKHHASGELLAIIKDTLVLNSTTMYSYNKKYSDSIIKISIPEINKIYNIRSKVQGVTICTTLLSVVTALIISPLISIQKNGFNKERFAIVSGTSIGIMALSITIGATFGQKVFLIQPTKKNKKVWTINPD